MAKLSLTTPLGQVFDASSFATPLANGVMLNDVPIDLLGAWLTAVTGFDSKKAKAKLIVTPTQPKGVATITLEGAPTGG